jgi:hypothetical protein
VSVISTSSSPLLDTLFVTLVSTSTIPFAGSRLRANGVEIWISVDDAPVQCYQIREEMERTSCFIASKERKVSLYSNLALISCAHPSSQTFKVHFRSVDTHSKDPQLAKSASIFLDGNKVSELIFRNDGSAYTRSGCQTSLAQLRLYVE